MSMVMNGRGEAAIVEGGASCSLRHESARLHVTGGATYIDDIPAPANLLHVAPGLSMRAHARVVSLDLEAVRAFPGVVRVITAQDVPGDNQISPVHAGDEPLLAEGEVFYYGQLLFAVVAETRYAARRAARLAKVEYEDLPAILTLEEARNGAGELVGKSLLMSRGDAPAAVRAAPHMLSGRVVVGGQEQFYLEGQAAYALPGEDGEMRVFFLHPASDRNPAYGRACTGAPRQSGDGGSKAYGRRVWRKGNSGQCVCLPCGAGGIVDRASGTFAA
jgi:xanthine dehydrogenase large subunit